MTTEPDAYCTWCDQGIYILGHLTQNHRWVHQTRTAHCLNPTPRDCETCDEAPAQQATDYCGECLIAQDTAEGYDPYHAYA